MQAKLNNWRGSPRRFVKYLRAIKGVSALDAANRLKFMSSPYCEALRKLVLSAVANATNDASLDPKSLVVAEASVGRGAFLKRACFRGRGRVGKVTKFSSNVFVVLKKGVK